MVNLALARLAPSCARSYYRRSPYNVRPERHRPPPHFLLARMPSLFHPFTLFSLPALQIVFNARARKWGAKVRKKESSSVRSRASPNSILFSCHTIRFTFFAFFVRPCRAAFSLLWMNFSWLMVEELKHHDRRSNLDLIQRSQKEVKLFLGILEDHEVCERCPLSSL